MGVESAEDRASMLSIFDFGVAATIGEATVYVIFDDAHEVVSEVDGEVSTTVPQCIGSSSDLTSVVRGTVVTINSVAYNVIDIQPDGTGMTTLFLSRD